jgi:outer membrane lipoprotein-sorting protein
MHFIKKTIIIVTLLVIIPFSPVSAADVPDIEDIVKRVDQLYRSKTSEGSMEMTIVSENWTRTLKMDVWSEGMDKTFIHITYPKKDADIATLRIENEMWNYFPKINKVMKVPPSMMMSSWMGSDFTNDDLVKESSMLSDYYHKLIEPADEEPGFYYIELLPKEDVPTVWGKIIIKARKEDYIPVREDYYDEKGVKMRVMYLKDIKTFDDKRIPSVIELIPLNKKDKKTIITYKNLKFDRELDKEIFSLRNLQKQR